MLVYYFLNLWVLSIESIIKKKKKKKKKKNSTEDMEKSSIRKILRTISET